MIDLYYFSGLPVAVTRQRSTLGRQTATAQPRGRSRRRG